MDRKIPIRQTPLFNNDEMLDFDEKDKELSVIQKCNRFMSRWMDKEHPVEKYENYFKSFKGSKDSKGLILRLVKNNYKKFVLVNGWDEYKYVMVIDYIFTSYGLLLDNKQIEKAGELFDKEMLPFQKVVIKAQKRKKRI